MTEEFSQEQEPKFQTLLPFFIFVIFYLGLSLRCGDFYKVPMPVAFLVASASALLLNRRASLHQKVDIFAAGMGDVNIMLMCLIFILAGAFASVAKGMGAVDAAVLITRKLLPANFLLPGMFLVSSLISVSIGTSCGTIAAITPIAVGLAEQNGTSGALMLGAIIGGAMFGDNLSMISDTTIAAVRTQNVEMRDKFRTNFAMVVPAAVLVLILYAVIGHTDGAGVSSAPVQLQHWVSVLPYLLILLLSLCGLNVMMLLFLGTILAGGIGMLTGTIDFWKMLELCGTGTLSMAETLIVAILAGGLLKVIRWNGGIQYLLKRITSSCCSTRGCEFRVFLLTGIINLFTANNTVAIVIAGPIAKEISDKFHCNAKRIASILDTSSCVVQGLIPYGAQLLIATGIARNAGLQIESLSLLGSLYYQWLMGIAVLLSIAIGTKQKN